MNFSGQILLLTRIAARNIWLYRFRTVVTAILLGFGAFLAVFGLSLLRDIEASMRESITGSIAGDIQIYSKQAKDDLAIFGGNFMGRPDIGSLPDMVPYREAALSVANVKAFVPMGIDMAILGRGNELDDVLDALRAALAKGDRTIIEDRLDQLRFQLQQLKLELTETRKLAQDQSELDQQEAAIAQVEAPGFLAPEALDEMKLQFLETRIAPISGEKPPIYLNYMGTDLELYTQEFPKFRITEGETLPPGRRGILLSRKFREDYLKHQVARLFDRIHKRITKSGLTIADDADTRRDATDLPRQYAQIVSQLDRQAAEALSASLTDAGFKADPTLGLIERLKAQLIDFLTVDDHNFAERHTWFYEHIAPRLRLYEISPGETITLRSYTRSGYVKSVPLKVYGVYTFTGLEDSDLAGVMNIIDLVSFRELYGQMTREALKELEAMREAAGIRALSAENAEDALFGEDRDMELERRQDVTERQDEPTEALEIKPVISDRFPPEEVKQGLALNVALVLKDPDALDETMDAVRAALAARSLEARVVDWQTASGIVGQFVNIVRLALLFAIGIIFVVAFVIINNSIIVATLNRTREIGTMRAIGAQRGFVVGLFLVETWLIGLLGTLLGAALAGTILIMLAGSGIPAGNDVVAFLFSGPRLYPHVRWPLIVAAPFVVSGLAVLASTYAARHAAHVKPAEAMQERE